MDFQRALAESIDHGAHAKLRDLVGSWQGRARLWLEPDVLTWDDEVAGAIVPLHGGRWVRHDYTTRIEAADESGTALIGFHIGRATWQVAWVDSWHTGSEIQFSTGPLVEGAPIDVLTSYGGSETSPAWGWRTTFEPDGTDALVVRHYNITPEGDEALAVQFDYTRV